MWPSGSTGFAMPSPGAEKTCCSGGCSKLVKWCSARCPPFSASETRIDSSSLAAALSFSVARGFMPPWAIGLMLVLLLPTKLFHPELVPPTPFLNREHRLILHQFV